MNDANRMPEKIAVIGAGGMLGQDVVKELRRRGLNTDAFDRAACDVTKPDSCRRVILKSAPGVVINCAAYTDVNKAESEEALALAINGDGARNVAEACAGIGALCIYVSTDYVFDGAKPTPWETTDATNPINAYGRTKLVGEQNVANALPDSQWLVARTSWLYGVNGGNFVKTMQRLAGAGKELKVINDQTGAPTYTVDLARALVDLASRRAHGIVHTTNSGACTWYEFAQEIFRQTGVLSGADSCADADGHGFGVSPCASSEFPTPARRPANSVLSARSLIELGVSPLPDWKDALRRYLAEPGSLKP